MPLQVACADDAGPCEEKSRCWVSFTARLQTKKIDEHSLGVVAWVESNSGVARAKRRHVRRERATDIIPERTKSIDARSLDVNACGRLMAPEAGELGFAQRQSVVERKT